MKDNKYWDRSYNWMTGCTKITEECDHCWAERFLKLRGKVFGLSGPDYFMPFLHLGKFGDIFKFGKKRKVIFVGILGDIFHESIHYDFLDHLFYRMSLPEVSHHIFLICTKRAERMAYYANLPHNAKMLQEHPNIIGMVTAGNQQRFDERVPHLLKTPFATKGVSVEPMLGPVDSNAYIYPGLFPDASEIGKFYNPINLIIAGPETGPGARPMEKQWLIDLYNQCKSAGVPFYDKRNVLGQNIRQVPWEVKL